MKPPFDLNKFRARIAVLPRDPRSPTDQPQEHPVKLLPINNDIELHTRWQQPQGWCREKVQYQQGHQWSRRMDHQSDQPEFTFSDAYTAKMFALRFQ